MKKTIKIMFFAMAFGFVSSFTLGCKQNLIMGAPSDCLTSDNDSDIDENNPRHCFPGGQGGSNQGGGNGGGTGNTSSLGV